ncbi:MAG: fibronectin type III domain-containing protein [Cruoricaptor ignavus]|nr:fibronectin type III domain-containing protein [Cruoricaptor ignavus]
MLAFVAFAQNKIDPYLQAVTTNSIYVNWISRGDNPSSIVEYGTAENQLNVTATGSFQHFSAAFSSGYNYHTVKLTDLEPNTKYYYKIRSKQGNTEYTSDIKSFKTLPNPGEAATEDGHIRFLVLGDNQLRHSDRYNRLVAAAKKKIAEKWGADKSPADNVAMTVMVGDQVDTGTLDHYENVHFAKNKELSGYLPIQTLIGNHETYGTLGITGYKNHFILDEMEYKDIKSGTENYYARQAGNVLFIGFDTEYSKDNGNDQLQWLKKIMTEADKDETVEWIISLGHRPYQAEQYVGDISEWVRYTAFPVLKTSEKFVLHIGAHHHLYSRGQIKDNKVYNIISGGTAWDQYWGMSSEQDFDDVQKTIPNWIYQIIDIDVKNKKFNVEAYSIGSLDETKDNVLMDEFHRYKNQAAPNKPSIISDLSGNKELPLEIASSEYSSTTEEKLNTTQFLISKTSDFVTITKEVYRDYENLFGKKNGRRDESKDLNEGVDIQKMTLEKGSLANGTYYVKVRHRDQNLEWSDWSDAQSFTIINSTPSSPEIEVNKTTFALTDDISVTYSGGAKHSYAWVGIYDPSQNPGGFGSAHYSWAWEYTNAKEAGNMTFKNIGTKNGNVKYALKPGRYYAALFKDSGYNSIAKTPLFYVGEIPELKTDKQDYDNNETVKLSYKNSSNIKGDKVAIFKVGKNYQNGIPAKEIIINKNNDDVNIENLEPGYYYAEYFVEGTEMTIGNRAFFKVGGLVTNLLLDKKQYELGEKIVAKWTDAPGIAKDWIGIYKKGDDPNTDSTEESGYSYTYFDGKPEGEKEIAKNELPKTAGDFFAVIFTNDSYNEISNRVYFEVIDATLNSQEVRTADQIKIYPNPTRQGESTFIESRFPINKIELYDMSGKLIYATENVNQNKFSLISHQIPKGTYVMSVYSRKIFTYKLIVN